MGDAVDRIRQTVIGELEDLAPNYSGRIKDTDRLLDDLGLTGDDASIFAMQAATRLGIKVPLRAWNQVYTVGDAIDILMTHLTSSASRDSRQS